jgi:acetyl esterase/lipase
MLKKSMCGVLCIFALSVVSVKAGTVKIIRDVVYSTAAGAAGVGDIYFPDGYNADTPVALAIHGGGWSGLDRYSWSGVADFLCSDLGFVVFNIEYRLTGVAKWPACGDDCIAAANYLLSSDFTQQYGINCEKVWPCGGSSGGHLALWTGVSLPPADVGGIISISGIGDLIPDAVVNPSRYVSLFGYTPTEAELIAASPMTLVTADSPGVICTHARIDTVVPPASTQNFVDACRAAGVPVDHFIYEQRDTGHSVWIPDSNPHKLFADIESAIAKFVWDITGTKTVVGQDDFYEEISVTEDTLFTRPLIDNQARKTGAGTATLVNPRMSRSTLTVAEGGVRVVASDTFVAPGLPDALQQKAAFWVDANTNVVADSGGVVSRWHDVREASVDGPYSYMMATNTDISRQPTVVSDAGLNDKK